MNTGIKSRTINAKPSANQHHKSDRFVYTGDSPVKNSFNWASFVNLFDYIKPYMKQILVAAAFVLFGTLAQVAAPAIIAIAIDQAINPKNGDSSVRLLLIYAALMFFLCVLQMAISQYRIRKTNKIGQQIICDLRLTLFRRIQSMSLRFFDKMPAGSILQRLTGDIAALEDLVTNGTVNLIMDIFQLIGVITILLIWNFKLGLLIVLTVPLIFAVSSILRKKIRVSFQEMRLKQAYINAHLNDAIQGIKVTQAYEQEKNNIRYFERINGDNIRIWDKASALNQLFIPIIQLSIVVDIIILFLYGSHLVETGVMTVGLFVGYANYMSNFWEPVQRIGQLYSNLLVGMASSERIFEFIKETPGETEAPNAKNLAPIKGEICFEQVVFKYDENLVALRGIDLTIYPGQTVALVGSTGAGKSTLVNLLCRFYDPSEGRVLIDGTDIREVTLHSLRSQISIVLQDTFIFLGTVRENIRYGNLDATDEEVEQAAKSVFAHDFILRLPQGYDTLLQEQGGMLSTGQKQLVSFARAIIANPRILILDEATANIDTETDKHIQQALNALQSGRTTVIVAHRLSTIRDADQIYVLDHGELIEQGRHQELIENAGTYRKFIEMQKFLAAGE
ncbi:ABC transporter ATP-binding protein [Paenibacillus oralis]|uniref:ABC transporter ATP-binding protein n=1 Tax=Paenibacillus oralis TaxID=2490856 RepID=A0A3P3TTZ9_9BACL|nr:ABC transporter ATP-binding protein [Paenibacillus oralis]RRJ61592.1 ABC transporter ATP-binding protein [Paenibacillus oralis]